MNCINKSVSPDFLSREPIRQTPRIVTFPPVSLNVSRSCGDISLPQIEITMSTTTLTLPMSPPVKYSPLAERRMASSNCLTPSHSSLTINSLSATTQSPGFKRSVSTPAMTKSARRVNLGPGCSMLDWIRLCKNMKGNGGNPLSVTEDELARHSTESDAWTCYKGNCTFASVAILFVFYFHTSVCALQVSIHTFSLFYRKSLQYYSIHEVPSWW